MPFLQRFAHPPTPASPLTNYLAGCKSPNRLGSSFEEDLAVAMDSVFQWPLMGLNLWGTLPRWSETSGMGKW